MKKSLLLLAVLYVNILSQTHYIKGYILEQGTREPLAAANIVITGIPSKTIYGAASDIDGKFRVDDLEKGKYSLKISFVGYAPYVDTLTITRNVDLGNIYLSPSDVLMDDVEVIEKAIPVVMNADTTEYNADAFTTHKNATAEDLLSKMPGITVDDGSVETQGESVTKIVVDGKEFFSNDPAAVLKNLPAEMVEKFQVYDEKSEQAKFTGFDDGNTSKTINIVTRERFRNGTFGKLAGGYGSEERYLGGVNLNIFNNDRRISVVGQLNNINQQNFSSEDILGVMPSGRGNRGGGGSGRRGAGGGPSSGGLVSSQSGLSDVKSGGTNYSDEFGNRLKFNGNYFYNNTDNNVDSYVDRDYLLTSTNQNYIEESNSDSKNINHRLTFRLDYDIDSSNSILFMPNLTLQDNESASYSSGTTYINTGLLNESVSESGSNLSAVNFSPTMLFRHRFKTDRRTFSINLDAGYNNKEGNKDQYTENTYYDSSTVSETVNQVTDIDNKGYNGSFDISYTEPAGKNGMVMIDAYYSYSNDENNQNVFDLTENNSLDTSLSNVYSKVYKTQRYRAGYNWNMKPFMFMADLSYNIADLAGEQTFPYSMDISKTFYSFLPSMMFNYNVSRNRRMSISYRTQNDAPSITQLQNVLDNSNTLQLSIGNPDLAQTYSHSLNFMFFTSKPSKSQSLSLRLSGTVTKNYIANNTIIADKDTVVFDGIELNQGVQITRPVNLSGYISITSFISYGLPVDFIKSNISLDANARYSRTPSISNNIKNFSNSSIFGLGFTLSSNVNEDLDFTLSSNTGYNLVKNSIKEENDKSYLNQKTKLNFYLNVYKGFVLQSEFQHTYEGGLSDDYDPNSYTLNLSVGKTLFNSERGELKFSVYDLLNQSSNIQRNITDTYTEDRQTNIIGQFFLVSFTYNLRTFF